jgi:hypothetical protein
MNTPMGAGAMQSVYDYWLGLIPQFFSQLGAGTARSGLSDTSKSGLPYPADQVARAALMTQEALQNLAKAYMPMLQAAGAPGLLGQWAAAMPQFERPEAKPAEAAPANWQSMFGPWAAAMPFAAGAQRDAAATTTGATGMPAMLNPWAAMLPYMTGKPAANETAGGAAPAAPATMFNPWAAAMPYLSGAQKGMARAAPGDGAGGASAAMFAPWLAAMAPSAQAAGQAGGAQASALTSSALPFQAMQQAWLDMSMRLVGASPQTMLEGFDRTFGALGDALGLGPVRKLQTAYQDLINAGLAQHESRAAYAILVQRAFAAGLDGLLVRLAAMADSGERVESVLALLKMWAVSTEHAVHAVLQSEEGLAATAALARAGVTYRRKLQHIAAIVADALDMATRRELDEAFREIQDLKRELRALRPAVVVNAAAAEPAPRKAKRKPAS